MTTILEKAWKKQKQIELQLQNWKNCLPSNTLYWRYNDFTVFFFGTILFFGTSILIMFLSYNYNSKKPSCSTDWWVLPMGIGFVFLILLIVCKKVEDDSE